MLKKPKQKTQIWTMGHSNYSIQTFIELIKGYEIEVVIDVRRFPTSKIEHFKQEQIKQWLSEYGVEYVWLGEQLGGYRKGGYRNHMQTKLFKEGIQRLLKISKQRRACIMCMEINPKYCHRRFISQYLEKKGVSVFHILRKGQNSLTTLL